MTKVALVTGSAGFVGRHVTKELTDRGWWVRQCDIRNRGAGSIYHDFVDLTATNNRVYDLVVHCAAVGAHRAAIDGQPYTFAQNMKLDASLFEWAIRTKQTRVLYISSSAAYPVALQTEDYGDEYAKLREIDIHLDDPQLADGTYGITKLTGEHLAEAARAAGVPVTVVRPFSGYGEDQGTDWPFGAFLQRIRDGVNPFVIWGSGEQRRDWIHIDDVVNGMLAIVDAEAAGPVNLCTGVGTSMFELVDMMMNLAGQSGSVEVDTSKPLGVMNRVGDPARFFQYYTPRVPLEEGVYRALKENK